MQHAAEWENKKTEATQTAQLKARPRNKNALQLNEKTVKKRSATKEVVRFVDVF